MANDRNDALKDYVEVNVRIDKFHQKYPNGRIETEVNIIDAQPREVLVKASVFRDITDMVPSATGHAHEVHGSSYINRTSFIENAETSAVGRALAILGFEIKKSVASREEVANAQHQQQSKPQQPKPNNEKPLEHQSQYPSDAQLKMLNQKLMACGYTGEDKAVVFKLIGDFLGYEIKQLLEIKKSDVTKLAEYLAKHKKAV